MREVTILNYHQDKYIFFMLLHMVLRVAVALTRNMLLCF